MKPWPHPDDESQAPVSTAELLLVVGLTAFGWVMMGKSLAGQLARLLA